MIIQCTQNELQRKQYFGWSCVSAKHCWMINALASVLFKWWCCKKKKNYKNSSLFIDFLWQRESVKWFYYYVIFLVEAITKAFQIRRKATFWPYPAGQLPFKANQGGKTSRFSTISLKNGKSDSWLISKVPMTSFGPRREVALPQKSLRQK